MTQEITTERLVLRPFVEADADRIVAILSDFAVSKWLAGVPHPFTRDDVKLFDPDGTTRWPGLAAITLGGEIVGAVMSGARLSYYVAPDYWGQGIGTEAAAAMVAETFRIGDIPAIDSCVFAGNAGSTRILEKIGFTFLRQSMAMCQARGQQLANVEMRLTRSDWEVLQ